ncbi:hypothetical protein MMC08_004349 [Hypocenomyce scalaris]|nr:hypothetical protein [Hypocenomyce scalaris]
MPSNKSYSSPSPTRISTDREKAVRPVAEAKPEPAHKRSSSKPVVVDYDNKHKDPTRRRKDHDQGYWN